MVGLSNNPPPSGGGSGEGMANPMTTANDLIVGGSAGVATRLGKGANGTYLGVNDLGSLAYSVPAGGGDGNTLASIVHNAAAVTEGKIWAARNNGEMYLRSGLVVDIRDVGGLLGVQGSTGSMYADDVTATLFEDLNFDFTAVIPDWGRAPQVGDYVAIERGRSGARCHVTPITAIAPGGNPSRISIQAPPSSTIPSKGNTYWTMGPPNQHVAWNAAGQAVNAYGGGYVHVPGPIFVGGTCWGYHRVKYTGGNYRRSSVFLQDGVNAHLFRPRLSGTDGADRNAQFIQLESFRFEANGSGQTGGPWHAIYLSCNPLFSRLSDGSGRRMDEEDDMEHILTNIFASGASGTGFYWEGLASFFFSGLQAEYNSEHGFFGTSDTHAVMCEAGLNGKNGFRLIGASSQFVGCKAFTSGNDSHADGWGWYVGGRAGAISLIGCDAQENWLGGLYVVNARGVTFLGSLESNSVRALPSIGEVGTPAAVLDGSKDCNLTILCSDSNWNADGGSQKNAVGFIRGSENNGVIFSHLAGDKGYGEAYIEAPVADTVTIGGVPHASSTLRNSVKTITDQAYVAAAWPDAAPANAPTLTSTTNSGTSSGLPSRTLHAAIAFITHTGIVTGIGPSASITVSANQILQVAANNTIPAWARGYVTYIGTAADALRRQPLVTTGTNVFREPNQGYLTTGEAPATSMQMRPEPYEWNRAYQVLGGNLAFIVPEYAHEGQQLELTFEQDSTGGWIISWPASVLHNWIQNTQPNRRDTIRLRYDGTNWIQVGASPKTIFSQRIVQTTGGTLGTGDTVANSIANNNFATRATIPANQIKEGTALKIIGRGVYSAVSTPTIILDLKAGATTLVSSASNTVAAVGNSGWEADILLTVKSINAGVATCEILGTFYVQKGTANGQTVTIRNGSSADEVNIDTTVNNELIIAVTWNTASPSNTITMKQLLVEAA